MSSTSPAELTGAAVIERIAAGAYPREVVATIARGFLPLSQDDLVAVLAYLAASEDVEIGELSRTSLRELPARTVMTFAANETAPPEHLGYLARATDDEMLLEALIRNRAVNDDTVAELARSAGPVLQEVIVINHARILRAPHILDALLENPRLTADARRRIDETREEFFAKRERVQRQRELDEEAADNLDVAAAAEIADLLERAEAEDAQGAAARSTAPELAEIEQEDPEQLSMWGRILKMSVAQKVHLAFKTDKTGRMILVRDRNKLVCSAVMRNPRMTDSEVELIAGMRNVDEEVLRLITSKREWMSKYSIVSTLARNPKAPLGVVLPLINRLTLRDLKGLKDDKGVTETVRALARKLFQQRSKNA